MSPVILIVEDDPDLLFLYRTALGDLEHEIVEARNSEELRALLAQPNFVPALAVLDIEMTDSTNLRAIDTMRTQPQFAQTRIVIVTANENYRDRLDGQVDYYLVKPVGIAYLTNIIAQLIAQNA
jgi:CheY-like chemotaxis protein